MDLGRQDEDARRVKSGGHLGEPVSCATGPGDSAAPHTGWASSAADPIRNEGPRTQMMSTCIIGSRIGGSATEAPNGATRGSSRPEQASAAPARAAAEAPNGATRRSSRLGQASAAPARATRGSTRGTVETGAHAAAG